MVAARSNAAIQEALAELEAGADPHETATGSPTFQNLIGLGSCEIHPFLHELCERPLISVDIFADIVSCSCSLGPLVRPEALDLDSTYIEVSAGLGPRTARGSLAYNLSAKSVNR